MLHRFREHFGTAGLVVAVVALIAALAGGALASSGGGGGSASASKTKAKKGATGPRGPKGAKGATGAAGPAGAKGDAGANGANGAPGAAGKSVVAGEEPAGTNCVEGGAKFEVEGSGKKSYACDGEEGPEGPEGSEGSPWTVNGTLPAGATETGAWAFNASAADSEFYVPISIPISLDKDLEIEGSKVHVGFPGSEPFSTFCKGVNVEKPTAPEGELCVYISEIEGATFSESLTLNRGGAGISPAGGFLVFNVTATGFAAGSWAVGGADAEA